MELFNSLKFVGDINIPVIFATVLLSWFIITQLKTLSVKFPFRQVIPFVIATILTALYEWSVGSGIDRTVVWDSLLTALVATGGYSKVKSLLKDRGIQF